MFVRFILIFCVLMFVLPAGLTLVVSGFGAGLQIYYVVSMMQKFGLIEDIPSHREWNVINVRNDNNLSGEYRTLVEPGRLQSLRYVAVSTIMTADQMTAEERGILSDNIENDMKLYAPQFAMRECDILQKFVADKCVVERTNVRALGSGQFEISARMTFTTKEAFGSVPTSVPLSFVEVAQNLSSTGGNSSSTVFSGQTEARTAMYKRAAEVCEQTRANRGNCAIRKIELTASKEIASPGTVRLRGSATLSLLVR